MKELALFSSKTQKNIAKQVLLGFITAIIIGAIILSIPQMTESGKISYIDAIFTSTSAVCVTGLIVQDTPTYFTDLGKNIDDFFDNVLVMDGDDKIRANRINLVKSAADLYMLLADFSKLVVGNNSKM